MATKSDIIKKIVEKHSSLGVITTKTIINKFLKTLSCALKKHKRIEFRGFGSFSIRSYNLKEVKYSASSKFIKNQYFKIYFRSSKNFSNFINE